MVGICLWLGGVLATITITLLVPSETPAARASGLRMVGRIHSWLILPGILLALVTGFVLVGRLGTAQLPPSVSWMAGIGLVGGLFALFAQVPTAMKLAAISPAAEQNPVPPALHRVERRLTIVSTIATVLVLAAMYFGAVV
jgi:hypothetical protein